MREMAPRRKRDTLCILSSILLQCLLDLYIVAVVVVAIVNAQPAVASSSSANVVCPMCGSEETMTNPEASFFNVYMNRSMTCLEADQQQYKEPIDCIRLQDEWSDYCGCQQQPKVVQGEDEEKVPFLSCSLCGSNEILSKPTETFVNAYASSRTTTTNTHRVMTCDEADQMGKSGAFKTILDCIQFQNEWGDYCGCRQATADDLSSACSASNLPTTFPTTASAATNSEAQFRVASCPIRGGICEADEVMTNSNACVFNRNVGRYTTCQEVDEQQQQQAEEEGEEDEEDDVTQNSGLVTVDCFLYSLTLSKTCGCQTVESTSSACSICGTGEFMTRPNASFFYEYFNRSTTCAEANELMGQEEETSNLTALGCYLMQANWAEYCGCQRHYEEPGATRT